MIDNELFTKEEIEHLRKLGVTSIKVAHVPEEQREEIRSQLCKSEKDQVWFCKTDVPQHLRQLFEFE